MGRRTFRASAMDCCFSRCAPSPAARSSSSSMLSWPCTLAAVLYLLPLAVLQLWRARADRPGWEIALDIPFAVSIDLLVILLLARFTTLEHAVVLSRVGWSAGAAAM